MNIITYWKVIPRWVTRFLCISNCFPREKQTNAFNISTTSLPQVISNTLILISNQFAINRCLIFLSLLEEVEYLDLNVPYGLPHLNLMPSQRILEEHWSFSVTFIS